MANKIHRQEFAVIGLGRFGSSLARRLEGLRHTVLGIDSKRSRVQDIADEITDALILDATNEEALQEIDIAAFDTVIVAIAGDFEANALTTASLKRLVIQRVISLASTDRHRDILLHIGADQVIQPLEKGGRRLAEELVEPGVKHKIVLSPNHIITEMPTPPT